MQKSQLFCILHSAFCIAELPRRPGEAAAGEQVQVDVEDRLACIARWC